MQYLKKYNNFLFVIVFGFYSLTIGSDYIPFSPSEITETSRIIPTIISENPKMALVVSAAVLLGSGMLYFGKDKVSNWAEKRCAAIQQDIQDECTQSLKKFEESSWKNKALLCALRPFAGGAKEYWEYNQKYIGITAVLMFMGTLAKHPYIAAGVSGMVLAKGWWDQGLAAVKKALELINKSIDDMKAENLKLHEERRKEAADIKQMIEGVDSKVGSVDTKAVGISQQVTQLFTRMDTFEETVKGKFFGVERLVTDKTEELKETVNTLGKELKEITREAPDLKNQLIGIEARLTKLGKDNEEMKLAVKDLLKRLDEEADLRIIAMQEKFDRWSQVVLESIGKMNEENKESMKNLQEALGKQGANLDQLSQQLTQMMDREKANNEVINTFKDIYAENTRRLESLSAEIKSFVNDDRLNYLMGIAQAYEKSNTAFVMKMSEIESVKEACTAQYSTLFKQIETMRKEIIDFKEASQKNHKELKDKLKKRKQENRQLKDAMSELERKFSQQLLAFERNVSQQAQKNTSELKKQHEITQNLLKSTTFHQGTGVTPVLALMNSNHDSSIPLSVPISPDRKKVESVVLQNQQWNPLTAESLALALYSSGSNQGK